MRGRFGIGRRCILLDVDKVLWSSSFRTVLTEYPSALCGFLVSGNMLRVKGYVHLGQESRDVFLSLFSLCDNGIGMALCYFFEARKGNTHESLD